MVLANVILFLLFSTDKNSLSKEIKILIIGNSGSIVNYKFEVQDAIGVKGSAEMNIKIK